MHKTPLTLALLLSFISLAVELPMTNPPAPFQPTPQMAADKASEPPVPIFDGDNHALIWGTRKLHVFPCGFMVLTESEQEIARIHVYANTPHCPWITNLDTSLKAPATYGRYLGIDSIQADAKTQTITVRGKVPCHPQGKPEILGTYCQTTTMHSDGSFSVNLTYQMPQGQERSFMSMFCYFAHARTVTVGEQTFPFAKKERRLLAPKNLTIRDRHETPMDMELFSKGSVCAFLSTNAEGTFRLHGGTQTPGKGNVHFRLRLPVPQAQRQDHAQGVNFMQVDDLDLARPPCRNMVHNPIFAQGRTFAVSNCLIYPWKGTVLATLSQDHPKFGKNCLKVTYDEKTKSTRTVIKHSTLSVGPGTYTVSFYARADKPGQTLELDIKNHAAKIYAKRLFTLTPAWERYQLTARIPAASALTPRFIFAPVPGGNMFLDGIQVERGKTATPFTAPPVSAMLYTSAKDDFIELGKPIQARLTFTAWDKSVQGTADITVRDTFRNLLHTQSFSFNLKPHEGVSCPLALEGKIPQGVHTVQVTYRLPKQSYGDFFRFSVMPFFSNRHKLKNMFSQYYAGGCYFSDAYPGLETYLRRSMHIGSGCSVHQPYPTQELVKLCQKYNHEILDVSIGTRTGNYKKYKQLFPQTNPLPGHTYMYFYFTNTRQEHWQDKGLLLPDYRLVGGWNEDYRKKAEACAAQIVAQAPPRRFYVFGSEFPPEIKNDPHYPDLVMAIRNGVKSVYPDASLIEGGSYNMDIGGGVREIDQFLTRIRGRMPVEAIQTHTYTRNILSLEPNFKALVNMVENKHGLKNMAYYFGEGMHYGPHEVPAWGLESANWDLKGWIAGPLSYDIGWGEKKAAAYFMRSWLIFMTKCNQVISACSSVCDRPSNFQLDLDFRARVYQKIPNTLSLLLGNVTRFVADVSFAPDSKCLIWEDEQQRPVAAVWYQNPEADKGFIQGPWATADFKTPVEFVDMMGAKRTPMADGRFPVSPFPFFIRGPQNTVESLKQALANARLIGQATIPFRVVPHLKDRNAVELTIINTVAREVKGTLTTAQQNTDLKLPPFGRQSVQATMPQPLSLNQINNIALPYTFSAQGQNTQSTFSARAFVATPFKGSWDSVPAIPITHKSTPNSLPPDDLAATYQIAWDKDSLHLRVTVTDNQFAHQLYDNQAERWNNDSLQIFIDTRCSALANNTNTFDDDDYAYSIFPSPDGTSARMHRWQSPDIQLTLGTAAPKDMTFADDIPCSFTRTPTGYVYETAIPARYLLPARLEKNYSMGFALFVNDRDDGKKVKQSLTTTPAGTAPFNRPHLYPIMLLAE